MHILYIYIYNVTGLNVDCILLKGPFFFYTVTPPPRPRLIIGVRLTLGRISSLSGQQAREDRSENLVPRWVQLFRDMVVLLAK